MIFSIRKTMIPSYHMDNSRFLRAIRREPVDRTPVWLMRQAGRYLPEYQKVRKAAGDFMTLCKTPALAAEVTLQPLRRYALDAGIIFSDILTIPDAMGLGLAVIEKQGPCFKHPLQTVKEIRQLSLPDSNQLRYTYEAIRLVQKELHGVTPLIGFAGSPFTLAAYMLEGKARPGFPKIQELIEKCTSDAHYLLNLLAEAVAHHLHEQALAGAQAVMIFDSWGGLLNNKNYIDFSLSYVKKSIARLRALQGSQLTPVILFTKGAYQALESMSKAGCDMMGVDWTLSLREARERVGNRIALQGNLNPAVLLEDESAIRKAVAGVLNDFGVGVGHVFNLGHGVLKETPPENVAVLIDAVREMSKQ